MVDLSKLKAGYMVKFLCGGEAEIQNVPNLCEHRIDLIFTKEPSHAYNYMHDGSMTGAYGPRMFDIIEIIPAGFDWDTVKPGMAFKWTSSDYIYRYIGLNVRGKMVMQRNEFNDYDTFDFGTEHLTRAPEHDIEVQS